MLRRILRRRAAASKEPSSSEETGLEAASWLQMLQLDAFSEISSEQVFCFVAWEPAQEDDHPDQQESLNVRRLPFGEALRAATSGGISDAPSVALLLTLAERARRGELSPPLIGRLRAGELQ